VPGLLQVLAAVQLHDQGCLGAGEVGVVRADAVLAAEPVASQPAVAQGFPEAAFGFGLVVAQCALARMVLLAAHVVSSIAAIEGQGSAVVVAWAIGWGVGGV
jgi:hypothetical protein